MGKVIKRGYSIILTSQNVNLLSDDDGNRLPLNNAKVIRDMEEAGSLEFTLLPSHPYHHKLAGMDDKDLNIEVFEDEYSIFFGRVTEIKEDVNTNETVYCEGAIAFLNDSVFLDLEKEGTNKKFFKYCISYHNSQMNDENRKFEIGEITVKSKKRKFHTQYENVYDAIREKLLSRDGGYIFTERKDGKNYIHWLASNIYTNYQDVNYGVNLLDLTNTYRPTNVKTNLYGYVNGTLHVYVYENDVLVDYYTEPMLLECYVYNSKLWDTYGRLYDSKEFDPEECPDQQTLEKTAKEYLKTLESDIESISFDAADLYSITYNKYEPIQIGQNILVKSAPHGVDKYLPVLKIEYEIDKFRMIYAGLYIESNPTKMVYYEGEAIDYTGAVFYYNDERGNKKYVTDGVTYSVESGHIITHEEALEESLTVTVTYDDDSDTITFILYYLTDINIIKYPSKMEYELGEEINYDS